MNFKLLIFFVVAAALLGGLFVVFKPDRPVQGQTPAATTGPATPVTPLPRDPLVFDLVISGARLVQGPVLIKLVEGDEVVLRITSDVADDLHLHGYDQHLHLQPGVPAELRFKATRTGRFEYELHKAHVELGVIEVYPR